MTEYQIKVHCKNCSNSQVNIVRDITKILGKTKKCVYCGKTITLNKFNWKRTDGL